MLALYSYTTSLYLKKGPVKVLCPSIGECQDQEWEWVGWGAEGGGIGGFWRKTRKGITFEM